MINLTDYEGSFSSSQPTPIYRLRSHCGILKVLVFFPVLWRERVPQPFMDLLELTVSTLLSLYKNHCRVSQSSTITPGLLTTWWSKRIQDIHRGCFAVLGGMRPTVLRFVRPGFPIVATSPCPHWRLGADLRSVALAWNFSVWSPRSSRLCCFLLVAFAWTGPLAGINLPRTRVD